MSRGLTWRATLLLLISVLLVIAAFLVEPVSQDPAYHAFIDRRTAFSVPNFVNVFSNLPFAVVGLAGIVFVFRAGSAVLHHLRVAWLMFFCGVLLTAIGSAYYHWQPNNETLVWDRLAMTIGFMSFFAVIVGEYLSRSLGQVLLWPLLLVGAASVFYWANTEANGQGDLRAYALVQFLPMLLIPLIALLYRTRSDLGRPIAWMIVFYAAAKLVEFLDVQIYAAGGVVSGHSLKHVFASLAPASLLYGLLQRRYHAPRPQHSTE